MSDAAILNAPPRGRTILYDGLNLSLKAGTGVATYARGLIKCARKLGYGTGIVHSTTGRMPKDAMLREIMLFDDNSVRPLGYMKRARRWLRRQLAAPFGRRPIPVPISGTVLLNPGENGALASDKLFAVEDLFSVARHHFKRYGRAMNLTFGERPDLLHCSYPIPIRAAKAPAIYTIHDLIPLRLPYLSDDDKRYHYRLLRNLARHADHIVTVSETSRADIVKLLGIDEDRVTNTYQAVDVPLELRNRPLNTVQSELNGIFKLEWNRYFLFFGALEPKKNVARLVHAYLASGTNMPLVIVGAPGWKSEAEKQLVDDERFGFFVYEQNRIVHDRQIKRFEYVPFPLLVSLIRGARAVVFPSLYEGFGLPVLEAMQLGTPVVSSTQGSVPEVAGSAALLVNPYDTDALRQAIAAVAFNDDLCKELSAAGQRQAMKFAPDVYREAIRNLYARVL